MVHLPTACGDCRQPGVLYSIGVIPCKFGSDFDHDYPVVKCVHCRHTFFHPPPYQGLWKRCEVNGRITAFTSHPDAIDRTITLTYRPEYVAGVVVWWVDPAS